MSSGRPLEYHEFATEPPASPPPMPEPVAARRTACGNGASLSSTEASPVASSLTRAWPSLTCLLASTRISKTFAGRSVGMSFNIFIAESTMSTSPAATSAPTWVLTSVTCPANGAIKVKVEPAPPAAPAAGALLGAMWSFLSSTHVVCTPAAVNSSCVKMRCKKSLLIFSPPTTYLSTADLAAANASGKSAPRTMSLAIIGS
mmetsp:Transcript_27389/g.79409  ORF Transcript_27389/g.79409 Transcript_27389/m.79409 type:complete len:202 (-) Transcript_27389:132-737(-)